jgi:hypothetical protein
MELNDSRILDIVRGATDWRDGAQKVIAFLTQEGQPYSSGEVAAALRIHRPDLRFALKAKGDGQTVGEWLREQFFTAQLPKYNDPANPGLFLDPVQVARFTTGRYPDRTPAGVEVFVYGQDPDTCNKHEFEVCIPKPGESATALPAPVSGSLPASATGPGSTVHDGVAKAAAALPGRGIAKARVWPDNRLCIPRESIDTAVQLGNVALRQGQPVYITVEPGVKATLVFEDPNNGNAKKYSLVEGAGRVAFPSTDSAQPFTAGVYYEATAEAGKVTVDLTQTV